MAVAITESPRTSPHSPKPLLEVRMTLPRSYLAEMRENQGRGRQPVVGPDAELIDDEDLRGDVDPHPAVQGVLGHGPAKVFDEGLGPDEADPVTLLNGLDPQSHGQTRLAHAGRPEEDDVGRPGDKAQGGQLLKLAFIDRGLEGEVELLVNILPDEQEGKEIIQVAGVAGLTDEAAQIHGRALPAGVAGPVLPAGPVMGEGDLAGPATR
jgi:hypothetical protein